MWDFTYYQKLALSVHADAAEPAVLVPVYIHH